MANKDPRLDPKAWGGEETGESAWVCDAELALMNQDRTTRVSTLLFGTPCKIYAKDGDWSLIAGIHDGYLGWAAKANFMAEPQNPARVHTASTFVFPENNIKTPPVLRLGLGSWIEDEGRDGDFVKTPQGFVFAKHLAGEGDAVDYALQFLNVPYLWGGGSVTGIDCSGLTQISYAMMGRQLPRDSDQQEASLTEVTYETRKRGDLVYWKGHVGILENETTMIHATAFAMKTIREDLEGAIARIGEPTSFRRVT